MSGRARPVYDPWRDADGVPIPEGCRVVQIAVAKEHGALSSRLAATGTVPGRTQKGNRLRVRFEGEQRPMSIRPHLLRVLPEVLTAARVIASLEALRDELPASGDRA